MKKPILIAEIGGNHEGDFELAYELGLQAIEAGADYIKYQVYTADGLVNPLLSEARYNHFKRLSLSSDDYIVLAKRIKEAGGNFLASIWNIEDIKLFAPYMDFFKIGSGDLTCYPILKEITKTKKPIVLSTGLSSLEDVTKAVEFIKSCDALYHTDKTMISIMQCTSMYPTDTKDLNLSVITNYKELFKGHNIGYSHHHLESWPIDVAYSLGANLIEFHFTHDKSIATFRDHQLSLTKKELLELKNRLDNIYHAMGSCIKQQTESEINANHIEEFRRGTYLNKDITSGMTITEEDLVYLRPEKGIPASENIVGRIAKIDLKKFNKLDYIEFN